MTGTVIEAVRGPLMLIALGVVLAADQLGRMDLGRTWPALLILYGLLKLAEHLSAGLRQRQADVERGGI